MKKLFSVNKGQSLVELLVTIGIAAILFPALMVGFVATRNGKVQESQRTQATAVVKQTQEIVRVIREKGWASVATNGTFHPALSGNTWSLAVGSDTVNGFTRAITVSDVYRSTASASIIADTNGWIDPSTKKVTVTVSWTTPLPYTITATSYFTRYLDNLAYSQTTQSDFTPGTIFQTQVTNTTGGEVTMGNNTKGRWCSPAFSSATIDLPDGPPVAVAATASASTTIPNDVFVATAPYASSSVKLAYVSVAANTENPVPTLQGTFTLDSTKYSNASYIPSGINLTNAFKTNDIKYYKSSSGKVYALLATDLPDHEVVAIQINNGSGDAFQDPTNKIYKYWTFFNTNKYAGYSNATYAPNYDQAPFGYGAVALTIYGNRGYIASGGFLYVFDLSNIDSKSPANGLNQIGCRIELDGYDCKPNTGTDMKYTAGETGQSWSNTTAPAHNDCSDGGNVELYADHQMSAVQVGANTYVYVAVGAGTNPEMNIVNTTSVPTNNTNPKISNNSCGTSASGNAGWKRISSLDFDTKSNSEEAANSIYAKSDGTRAYMSSNGGIDANGDSIPDSDQFYVIDTTNKSSPKFLTTSSSGNGSVAASGYYNATTSADLELFPRRSLTVLNGQRAILVGQDGSPNNGVEPAEYQVVDITSESAPKLCGKLSYLPGFNDLTSVSEADGDNFVYMVANTTTNELKIIQGGPDGTYVDQGTFVSSPIDVGYSTVFNHYSATVTIPANTTIQFQFAGADQVNGSCTNANYIFTGPDGNTNTYYTATSDALLVANLGNGYKNPARCFKYKAFLTTNDYNVTPVIQDMTLNYSP